MIMGLKIHREIMLDGPFLLQGLLSRNKSELFSRTGRQTTKTEWKKSSTQIPKQAGKFVIVLEAIKTSWDSDISLDDISIKAGHC